MKKNIICCIVCVLFSVQHYLYAQSGVFMNSTSTMRNSIVWGNTDNNATPSQISGSGEVTYTAVEGTAPTGTGNIGLSSSPFIGEGFKKEDAYNLTEGSPCINGGTNDNVAETDLAGGQRQWKNAVDMGAYEYPYPRILTVKASDLSKTNGEEDPELEYVIEGDGVYLADDIKVQLIREEGEDIGEYEISISEANISREGATRDFSSLYTVTLQKGTLTILDETTGVENMENKLDVMLYPIPTTGQASLKITDVDAEVEVQVYNMFGTLLLERNFSGNENTLDMSSLADGILFVKITSGKKSNTIRVLKHK